MKSFILLGLALIIVINGTAKKTDLLVLDRTSPTTTIYIDAHSNALITWAGNELARDLGQLLNKPIEIKSVKKYDVALQGIYIGHFEDELIKGSPMNGSSLQNKWENFIIKKEQNNLFIVGSDLRGTAYGVFDFEEKIGISPWLWWADVVPIPVDNIQLEIPKEGFVSGPSVQYRGIFLNDEDWGLQPWAAKTFEPETGDIGPKTYEKIFQLLLRLKANTIWPAMHPCTKGFYTIPGNREMAEKYHIVVGTSHAEPMLRNNVSEWNKDERGRFNYFTNKAEVTEYWQERINEVKTGEQIFSVGMRGVHDSGMEGGSSSEEKMKMLETIISDQREMLTTTYKKPVQDLPQVLVPYKEVLELYDQGMKVPDDITLMWTDDNYGYIRRLSNEEEQKRSGGSGIYYHLSYWGRPHDYLWLSTTQPGLIWYEMSRAFQNGAQKIWIANVGDIKPAEYNMEMFLDLAWDVNSMNEKTIDKHLFEWCCREFGENNAEELTAVFDEYYRLAFLRKPEFMGWSRTEPSTATSVSEMNADEIQRRLDAYQSLYLKVETIKRQISDERQDAYFQLVEYPVKGAALMNQKFLFAQKSLLSTNSDEKENFAAKSLEAYNEIVQLTTKYNEEISQGKWNKMMSMEPRKLSVYQMPDYHLQPVDNATVTPVAFNASNEAIFLEASEFTRDKKKENYEWKTIEGLGYSNESLTLFPLGNHHFKNDLPYVEYRFDVEKAGNYQLEIRCLPNHSNQFDFSLFLEINDTNRKEYSINTKGRSEAWKVNVLRNSAIVKHPFKVTKAGKQTLRIYVNQTGIVLDQLAITPEGSPNFYEIPLQ
ncbi:MAG: glycosyl hydrolase 115 family protein [Prolixibacteraceae bacterium]